MRAPAPRSDDPAVRHRTWEAIIKLQLRRIHPRKLHARYLHPFVPMWQAIKAELRLRNGPHAAALLQLLLFTDFILILLHVALFYTGWLTNENFSLRRDKGYPEFFQYLKELWIALLFVRLAWQNLEVRYLAWAALFGYMLADDYLMLHENIGAAAANSLGFMDRWGLRAQDFGELGFYLLVGGTFCVLLLIAYRSGSRTFRRNSIALFVLLILFACFAVAGDLLHIVLPFPALDRIFDILEDGSEMIVMSLILWYVLTLLVTTPLVTTPGNVTGTAHRVRHRQPHESARSDAATRV